MAHRPRTDLPRVRPTRHHTRPARTGRRGAVRSVEVHARQDAQILLRGSHRLRQLRPGVLERPGRAEPPRLERARGGRVRGGRAEILGGKRRSGAVRSAGKRYTQRTNGLRAPMTFSIVRPMAPYERFAAWQRCHELVLAVYRVTRTYPTEERYGLSAQARR